MSWQSYFPISAVLPPIIAVAIALYFMYKIYVRCIQIYLIRPKGEEDIARSLRPPLILSLPYLISLIYSVCMVVYLLKLNEMVRNDVIDSLVFASSASVGVCSFFVVIGSSFIGAEGLEFIMKEHIGHTKYYMMEYLTMLHLIYPVVLINLWAPHMSAIGTLEGNKILPGIIVFSICSIGAFIGAYLASRVEEKIITISGIYKRLAWQMVGNAITIAGLGFFTYQMIISGLI